MQQKYIVAWDFSKKASGTFYRILREELGTAHPASEYDLIQRSVALCRDDFIASRLAALAEHFGAKVCAYAIRFDGIRGANEDEARAFVDRILCQRLHRRGRHASATNAARKRSELR
jgi:hypothetical protein